MICFSSPLFIKEKLFKIIKYNSCNLTNKTMFFLPSNNETSNVT